MSKSLILSLLGRAKTGNDILQILDAIVEDVTQQNINDFAEYAAGLKSGTLEEIAF